MNRLRSRVFFFLLVFVLIGAGSLAAQQTAGSNAPTINRVLLISVDGFHTIDLANCVAAGTCPNLASLSKTAITYTNASSAKPSDSYPGLMAIVTGGTPISTGIWYDNFYDRALFPPGTTVCTGTPGAGQVYDSALDYDPTKIDGGASSHGGQAINPANLLVDPNSCKPVFPHSLLRVNTVFEVIKASGRRTAWTDKHPSYEITNGLSGTGVDELYTPEVDSNISSFSPPPSCTGTIWTDSLCAIEFYDNLKVTATLHQIDGFDHTGTTFVGVPAIFGMNFQAVSVGQKLANDPAGATGYADVNGTPNPGLLSAIQFVDTSIGSMVSELKKNGIFNDTFIIITAKHGQSPIDFNKINNTGFANGHGLPGCAAPPTGGAKGGGCRLDDSLYGTLIPPLAQLTDDDVALLWLPTASQSQTASFVATLSQADNEWMLGIKQIYSGSLLKLRYNDPLTDSRTPDIIVETNYGVIYTGGTKIGEHGGIAEDDTHVALLVSNPAFANRAAVKVPVTTAQVAPTILHVLGLQPSALIAVQKEHTVILPGLF